MQKTCGNGWCKASFDVTDEDLSFYDKVSPVIGGKKFLIPPPTRCPDCRLQRRLAWRNDRNLYKRTCGATGQPTLSIYSPDKPFMVYASSAWWKDTWDPLSFGLPVNFEQPFFEQFRALLFKVPRPALNCEQSENCDYCQNTTFSRNCYLCNAAGYNEDCYYSSSMTKCSNIVDSLGVHGSELLYDCINSRNCYNSVSLQNCFDCTDCALCFDCQGCRRCIGCIGLVHKDLHIDNKPVSVEEFEKTRSSMRRYSVVQSLRMKFTSLVISMPHRNVLQIGSEHCTGESIFHSKNARRCFDVENCEDATYSHHVKNFKDSMDVFGAFMGGELQYENSSAGGSVRTMCSYLSWHNNDCAYMNYCHNCSNCFGCISLHHKQYCILNTQYTKEEYESLLPKIIEHMRDKGEWGEFFPEHISPYTYNESAAQDDFPLTKEECGKRGWVWKAIDAETPNVTKTIRSEQLPDSVDDTPDDVLNWAIVCASSGKPFKLIAQELKFYRELHLPLPRLHPDVRYMERMNKRGYGKLWGRTCAKCRKGIQTIYAPDRPEIVHCEECYLKEIY